MKKKNGDWKSVKMCPPYPVPPVFMGGGEEHTLILPEILQKKKEISFAE